MRTSIWISLGVVAVVAIVVVGLTAGWALWGRHVWTMAPSCASEVGALPESRSLEYGAHQGLKSRWATQGLPCASETEPSGASGRLTIDEAYQAVEQYLESLGQEELEIADVMEFERNFYAIAREPDTGFGAMELLVNKRTGAVGPEMGPNMMWNTRYGMHRRGAMMARAEGANVVSGEDALAIAQQWLRANRPGVTVEEHPDPFYGYYTIHTLNDGTIEGMLSVHGVTGQVWYHTWHGEFVRMSEPNDHK